MRQLRGHGGQLKTARPSHSHGDLRPLSVQRVLLPRRVAAKITCHVLGSERLPTGFSLPQPLDYERIRQYSFTIEAMDPTINLRYPSSTSARNRARVIINITDVDEPPTFQQPFYHFQLPENTKKPLIGSVLAVDPDATRRSIG